MHQGTVPEPQPRERRRNGAAAAMSSLGGVREPGGPGAPASGRDAGGAIADAPALQRNRL